MSPAPRQACCGHDTSCLQSGLLDSTPHCLFNTFIPSCLCAPMSHQVLCVKTLKMKVFSAVLGDWDCSQLERLGGAWACSNHPGCTQAGLAAPSQKSDRWRRHVAKTGCQEAHPPPSRRGGAGLAGRQSSFFPGLQLQE